MEKEFVLDEILRVLLKHEPSMGGSESAIMLEVKNNLNLDREEYISRLIEDLKMVYKYAIRIPYGNLRILPLGEDFINNGGFTAEIAKAQKAQKADASHRRNMLIIGVVGTLAAIIIPVAIFLITKDETTFDKAEKIGIKKDIRHNSKDTKNNYYPKLHNGHIDTLIVSKVKSDSVKNVFHKAN